VRKYLVGAVAVAAGVLAYAYAPKVDVSHPASDLNAFFSGVASVLAAVLVAIALLSVLPAATALRVQQVVGRLTLLGIALGEVAALVGLVPGRSRHVYRVCFAVAAAATVYVLVVVLSVAAINLGQQFKTAALQRGNELAKGTSTPPSADG